MWPFSRGPGGGELEPEGPSVFVGVRLPADTRKWRRDTRNTQTETSLRAMNEEVCRTLNAAGPLDSEKETFFLLWLVKRPREEEDVRQPQLHFKDEGCFHFSMKY